MQKQSKPSLWFMTDEFAIPQAIEAWEQRDGAAFASAGYSRHAGLDLVLFNREGLQERGMYEAALVEAFTGCKLDNAKSPLVVLEKFFRDADRDKLLALGAPLPGIGPYVVYRGVRGKRVCGPSWTASLEVACWFAMRHNFDKPAVYRAVLHRDDVFLYVTERSEQEFIGRPRSCKRLPLSLDEIRAGNDRHCETIRLVNEKVMDELKARHKSP